MQHFGLKDHFLLAMPHLEDANFAGSLSYLCDHDENGTMGVIVNRPLELTLESLFEQLELGGEESPHRNAPVYYGGPVHKDRGFILHRGASTAGWEAGQLEQEILDNAWLTVEGRSDILFEVPPEQRLLAAAGILGVDLNLMTREAGHS
ncbi:MAG: YqgE/AlgH family protein [Halomonas sp.]|nr:YqgE/AlgH family protein [Halomonas sp.]